jgi:hypothetical protein
MANTTANFPSSSSSWILSGPTAIFIELNPYAWDYTYSCGTFVWTPVHVTPFVDLGDFSTINYPFRITTVIYFTCILTSDANSTYCSFSSFNNKLRFNDFSYCCTYTCGSHRTSYFDNMGNCSCSSSRTTNITCTTTGSTSSTTSPPPAKYEYHYNNTSLIHSSTNSSQSSSEGPFRQEDRETAPFDSTDTYYCGSFGSTGLTFGTTRLDNIGLYRQATC